MWLITGQSPRGAHEALFTILHWPHFPPGRKPRASISAMFSWWGSLIPGQNQSPDSSVALDSEPGLCAVSFFCCQVPGMVPQRSSSTVTQNCWLYPQVRDSTTGQYDPLCSNCAASKISPPTDPNIIAGPNTNTDMNASANTQSTPVPTMCRVSACVRDVVRISLSYLPLTALQAKTKV